MTETDRPDRSGWKGFMDEFRPSMFTMQIAVSTAIMIFSMVQLAKGEPIEVYLPVMTGISGYWLPAPKNKTSDEKATAKAHEKFAKELGQQFANLNNARSQQNAQAGFGSPTIPTSPASTPAGEIRSTQIADSGHIRVSIPHDESVAANVSPPAAETA